MSGHPRNTVSQERASEDEPVEKTERQTRRARETPRGAVVGKESTALVKEGHQQEEDRGSEVVEDSGDGGSPGTGCRAKSRRDDAGR